MLSFLPSHLLLLSHYSAWPIDSHWPPSFPPPRAAQRQYIAVPNKSKQKHLQRGGRPGAFPGVFPAQDEVLPEPSPRSGPLLRDLPPRVRNPKRAAVSERGRELLGHVMDENGTRYRGIYN